MTIFYAVLVLSIPLVGVITYVLSDRLPWLRRAVVPKRAVATTETATERDVRSSQQAAWLTNWMDNVESQISRHAFETDEFAEELAGASADDPTAILGTAAAMLVANRRLQADLATAHSELQKQRQKFDALQAESRIDALTGLVNRRGFDEELARRFDQWRRHRVPVSLLLVEIDGFREFVKCHGQATSEAAAKWVATLHGRTLRQMDIAAHCGDGQFAVILPGTKLADAISVAERLRATIASRPLRRQEEEIALTVSVGAAATAPGEDQVGLFLRADEALHKAKAEGRNHAFLHNGETAAIEIDENLVRYSFDSIQYAAPYQPGANMPAASAFRPLRSNDISAKGISLICDAPPSCEAFVVRLGTGTKAKYMVAKIANVTAVANADATQYRVGCAFVGLFSPADEMIGNIAPAISVAEAVAC
jgi:diguanylate cyclase (GGDEF)-like protein